MDGHPAAGEVMQRHLRLAMGGAGASGFDAVFRAAGTEGQGFGENPLLPSCQGVFQNRGLTAKLSFHIGM